MSNSVAAHKRPHSSTHAAAARHAAARKARATKGGAAQEKATVTQIQTASQVFGSFIPTIPPKEFEQTLKQVDQLDQAVEPILEKYETGTVVTWMIQQLAAAAESFSGDGGMPDGGQLDPTQLAGSCSAGDDGLSGLLAALAGGDMGDSGDDDGFPL